MTNQDAYSQYLILSLAQAMDLVDPHENYDIAWGLGGELLVEFETSVFNTDDKSEYDCMWEFLAIKKLKK